MSLQKTRTSLLFVLLAATGLPLTSQAVPLVHTTPSTVTSGIDESVLIDVRAEGITDLFSYNFSLNFDPAVLSLTAITEGSFLPASGSTFFIPGAIDNLTGTASFTGGSLLSETAGASGSGVLASFLFQTVRLGNSEVMLSDPLFLDSTFADIAIDTAGSRIEVRAPQPSTVSVPEPSTLVMSALAFGLLAVFGTKRRLPAVRLGQ